MLLIPNAGYASRRILSVEWVEDEVIILISEKEYSGTWINLPKLIKISNHQGLTLLVKILT